MPRHRMDAGSVRGEPAVTEHGVVYELPAPGVIACGTVTNGTNVAVYLRAVYLRTTSPDAGPNSLGPAWHRVRLNDGARPAVNRRISTKWRSKGSAVATSLAEATAGLAYAGSSASYSSREIR